MEARRANKENSPGASPGASPSAMRSLARPDGAMEAARAAMSIEQAAIGEAAARRQARPSRLARGLDALVAALRARPATFTAWLIGVYAALWLAVTFAFPSMPFDSYEMYAFGREMQLGYWKHPPLPAWLTEIAYRATGGWVFSHFLLAIGSVALTLYFVWRLGRETVGERGAALAVALTPAIYYFMAPVTMYSHNTAQLPVWAAVVYFYRGAVLTGALWRWLAFGVAAALMMYAKYSGALLLIVLAAHMLAMPEGRARFASAGPWLAVALGALLFFPNFLWLVHSDFLPFRFAFDRPPAAAGFFGSLGAALQFVVAQVFFHVPIFILIGLAALPRVPWQGPPAALAVGRATRFDRTLVLSTAIAPILIIAAMTFAAGVQQRAEIGGSLVALSGLAIVMLLPERITLRAPRLAALVWVLVLVGVPAGQVISVYARPYLQHSAPSQLWPAERLSEAMQVRWKAATDRPLAIVTGDFLEAGYVALYAKPRAAVFIDADFRKSPWIDRERMRREGTLVIWRLRDYPDAQALPPPYRDAFAGFALDLGAPFELAIGFNGVTARYGWAILRPAP